MTGQRPALADRPDWPRGRAFEWTDFTTGLLVFALALLGLYLVSSVLKAWAPAPVVG